MSRTRAATDCFMLESDISCVDDLRKGSNAGQEWEQDWSKVSTQLQPQHFKISGPRGALAGGRRRRCQTKRLVVRIAADADAAGGPHTCGARRNRARTMSDGFPSGRRS